MYTSEFFEELFGNNVPCFNHEGFLPPFVGKATASDGRSPYLVTSFEFTYHFATSKRRCEILKGFITYRNVLFNTNFSGFQWINGSFTQRLQDREPSDIDFVSFISHNYNPSQYSYLATTYNLLTNLHSKEKYSCDAYLQDISDKIPHYYIAERAAYWYSLFSHTRDKVWKGIIQMPLQEHAKEYDFCMAILDYKEASYE